MIKLRRSCKETIESSFKNNSEWENIINDILNINTPIDIVCNRVNFGKIKDKNGNDKIIRAVFDCKLRGGNNKIIIVRDSDGNIYLRQSDGSKYVIVDNKLEAMDIYRYWEIELDIFKFDMRRIIFVNN